MNAELLPTMHFQCWKVHYFKLFKQFCLPFALRFVQAGQQPAGHTPVCCDRCELNSILAMKGKEGEGGILRERERERAFKLFKWQCSKMLSMLKAKAIKALSTFMWLREGERGRRSDMCCKLQTLPACLPRQAVIWLADTQVLVNSLAHKNAST